MREVDCGALARYLTPSKAKLESKGVKSVASRVGNLKDLNPDITHEGVRAAAHTYIDCPLLAEQWAAALFCRSGCRRHSASQRQRIARRDSKKRLGHQRHFTPLRVVKSPNGKTVFVRGALKSLAGQEPALLGDKARQECFLARVRALPGSARTVQCLASNTPATPVSARLPPLYSVPGYSSVFFAGHRGLGSASSQSLSQFGWSRRLLSTISGDPSTVPCVCLNRVSVFACRYLRLLPCLAG